MLADLADRLLVPTFSTEPDVSCAFGRDRIGICKTGIEVNKFNLISRTHNTVCCGNREEGRI